MKHCVKKLLSLAFALALCLAVGGTALAETPEQEVLDYEPNVTTAAGTTTIDKLATEGYQVTIPTTVTVDSTTAKGTLEVKAQLKQYRTLNITMKPQDDKWTLKYQDAAAGANTPQVDYTLSEGTSKDVAADCEWQYQAGTKTLSFSTTKMQPSTSLEEDMKRLGKSSYELPITVPHPEQATMSGTYSDTVSFEFDLTKQCFTYIINVYGQEVKLTSEAFGTSSVSGQKYGGLQAVNMAGKANALYTEQYVLEYGINPDGSVVGGNPGQWQHKAPTEGEKRKAVDGTEKTFTAEDAADYALRWETPDPVTIDPAGDYAASETTGDKTKTKTIDLNLVRKWYWLDVNGATDYTGDSENIHGNQGGRIGSYVSMQVSGDGTEWSNWFWQSGGDDYWGQFPYGIHFRLGFHHVKNGYVHEMVGNSVKIIANGNVDQTKPGAEEPGTTGFFTTYYVYENTLTGAPIDISRTPRYCYIPCYKKGITYFANRGTGGTESVNTGNPPRSNVLYEESGMLKTPEELQIHAPSADMEFAGWSTSADYPTTGKLYQPGDPVSTVTWENYTDTSNRPLLNRNKDAEKRELYAIWKKPYTVKVQFGGIIGWTDWDTATQSFPEKLQGGDSFDTAVELGTAYAYGNTSLTLSETENKTVWDALQGKIKAKTSEIAGFAQPDAVWQIKDEYTTTRLPANGEAIIQIKRKRYLLNVIPALLLDDGHAITPAGDIETAKLYGKFDLDSCDKPQTLGGKISYYQYMRNYGGSYSIYNVEANAGYRFVGFRVIQNYNPVNKPGPSYSEELTGKDYNISYFKDGIHTYEGDTIYVVYEKDTRNQITFDYNGGTTGDGVTKQVSSYDETIRFPKVVLTHQPNNNVNHIGWSTEKNPTSDDEIFKLASIDPVNGVNPDVTTVSSKVKNWPNENKKVLYAVWSSTTGSDTPATGPSLSPAAKKVLTVRYHANFDPMEELALDLDPAPLLEDMDDVFGFEPVPLPEDVLNPLEEEVKTVTYKPDENVVLRHCMFKRAGYVFVGWNTEKDGTGKLYRVNGVPITDWAAGATVDLYAQWEKPHHLKPVDDSAPQLGGTTPAPTPPSRAVQTLPPSRAALTLPLSRAAWMMPLA